MKMFKKLLSLFCAAILSLSFLGCGSDNHENIDDTNEDAPAQNELLGDAEKLNYSSDKEFLMYPYGGVPGKLQKYDKNGILIEDNIVISDEQLLEYYQQIKDAGMNMTSGGYINMTYADYLRGLKVCEQIGLTMMVYDANLVSMLNNEKISDSSAVDQILTNYSALFESSAFAGISVEDEPTVQELSTFGTALRRWRIIEDLMEKEYIFYINLFPSIAFKTDKDGNFEGYIKKFCQEVAVDYICYDHYPLETAKKNYLVNNFLYNLVTVKSNSENRRCFTVLQSVKYGGTHRALQCVEDVLFQTYSAVACGYEGFGWFTFWPPVPNDGVTNFGEAAYSRQTNQPTDTYYYIKDGLNEVRKLEDVYFNFEWQGTKTIVGKENENGGENADFNFSAKYTNVETPNILSITTQQDTVVGVFKDKDGNDGYMVVNFTEPSQKLDNKVVMKLKDCTKAAVWEDGVQKVYKVENGWLTLNQKGGDGFFVVPIK